MSLLCRFGIHAWDGCTCTRCKLKRDDGHDFDGCACRRCGKVEHDFEVLEREDSYPGCVWNVSEECRGPSCGTWCDNYPGPGTRYEKLRCRRCGYEKERRTELTDSN